MLKPPAMAVSVIMSVTLLKLPVGRPPPGGGSGRKGRRPVGTLGLAVRRGDPASIRLKVGESRVDVQPKCSQLLLGKNVNRKRFRPMVWRVP